jgi:hypothetical protein
MDNDLPFIDEHRLLVSAPALAVWRSLATVLPGPSGLSAEILACLLGAEPRQAAGTPLDEGATWPGFEVSEATRARLVRLTGRHRFSRYALVLTLDPQPEGMMLSARTYARFPGVHGWVYQQLVIGSGAHRIVVARLLREVRRRAETHGGH